jgi:mono/diheme cytochrome c family protein
VSTYQDERVPFPSPRRLRRELRLRRPPLWLVVGLCVVVVLTWPPLALIARYRVSRKSQPRVHLIQDMDNQVRVSTQQPSAVFADGKGMRLPPPGSATWSVEPPDLHATQGLTMKSDDSGRSVPVFATAYPPTLKVDRRLLARGQTMYGVYCAGCHGLDGYGEGPVNQRAVELQTPGWVPAMSLHDPAVRGREEGFLYSAITRGVRTMPAHGSQIRPADRWAIVAYVRALQRSQNATLDDVPPPQRAELEQQP